MDFRSNIIIRNGLDCELVSQKKYPSLIMKKITQLSLLLIMSLFFSACSVAQPANKDVSENPAKLLITIKSEKDERVPSRYVCVGEYCDGSGIGDDVERTVLQIPLIQDGGDIGCGAEVFFAPHFTDKTATPLDETYQLLFDLKPMPEIPSDGFRNAVGMYTQLHYESVNLVDGMAKVFLTGNLYGSGHCSFPEIREQIIQAALQFETVTSVEVYLNDEIYDWCEQDMSDGEGSCPEVPDYWVY